MSAHTTDPHALTFTAKRFARRQDQQRRRVQVCACGAEYQATPDGRRQHRMLHGHTPTEDRS